MLMFRSFQQEAKRVLKTFEGGHPKLIPASTTYQQGRLKTLELLSCWAGKAAKGDINQEQLKLQVAGYVNQINMAYMTFQCYGFLIDRDELIAIRDYLKGQIECYRLYQPRIEVLLTYRQHP